MSFEILSKFKENPTQSYNYKQVSRLLKIKQSSVQKLVNSLLMDLVDQDQLIEVKRGKYRLNYVQETIIGKVDMTSKGSAFIVSEHMEQDVFVSSKYIKNALHGDIVEIALFPRPRGKKPEGEINFDQRAQKTNVGRCITN